MEQNHTSLTKNNAFMPISFQMGALNSQFPLNFLAFGSPQLQSVVSSNIQNQQYHCRANRCQLDQGIQYYKLFFSSKSTANSLQKRNQNLQMLSFQRSDGQEPDDVYNRRKKKVSDLMNQEEQQIDTLLKIRTESQPKFNAIINFIKFFTDLKQKIPSIRTDYYSHKTFCALKNSSQNQLRNLKKVVERIYQNVFKFQQNCQHIMADANLNSIETVNKIIEFLILPRFLISRQKINRLVRDQELQRNFQFLIMNQSLGHYNNEANKKMPEQEQMKYVKQLLSKKLGREKYKKICSINHGNKFLKTYGKNYFSLYWQSLNYLQYLDNSLKKGKKYDSIKKQLYKYATEAEQTIGNSSYTENQSSNNIYSFKSIGQCLNKIEDESEEFKGIQHLANSQKYHKQQSMPTPAIMGQKMHKFGAKKMMSTPLYQQNNLQMQCQAEKSNKECNHFFKVRKFSSMHQRLQQNIVLIAPPKCQEL